MKIVRHYTVEFSNAENHTLTVDFVGGQFEVFDWALETLHSLKHHTTATVYRREGGNLVQFDRVAAELVHELA